MGSEEVENGEAAAVPSNAETVSVGEWLRQARLAKNLTESDVAAYLRLSRNVVNALESNKYDDLPGLTFVCGYLRSYARYLELSGDEAIARFKMLGIVEPDRLLPAAITLMKKETGIGDGVMRFASYIIIFALAGLVILWWYSHNNSAGDQQGSDGNISALATNDNSPPNTADDLKPLPEQMSGVKADAAAALPANSAASSSSSTDNPTDTAAAGAAGVSAPGVVEKSDVVLKEPSAGSTLSSQSSPVSSRRSKTTANAVKSSSSISTETSSPAGSIPAPKVQPVVSQAPTNLINTPNTSSVQQQQVTTNAPPAAAIADAPPKVKKTKKIRKSQTWVEPTGSSSSGTASVVPKHNSDEPSLLPEFRH